MASGSGGLWVSCRARGIREIYRGSPRDPWGIQGGHLGRAQGVLGEFQGPRGAPREFLFKGLSGFPASKRSKIQNK